MHTQLLISATDFDSEKYQDGLSVQLSRYNDSDEIKIELQDDSDERLTSFSISFSELQKAYRILNITGKGKNDSRKSSAAG